MKKGILGSCKVYGHFGGRLDVECGKRAAPGGHTCDDCARGLPVRTPPAGALRAEVRRIFFESGKADAERFLAVEVERRERAAFMSAREAGGQKKPAVWTFPWGPVLPDGSRQEADARRSELFEALAALAETHGLRDVEGIAKTLREATDAARHEEKLACCPERQA